MQTSMERISAAALEGMEFDSIDLPGPYGQVLGPIGPAAYLLVWGARGSGKSTFCVGLAAAWAEAHGPAELVAIEEGPGPALQDKIQRLGIGRADLGIRRTSDVQELITLAGETSLTVVDSISEAGLGTDEVAALREAYKDAGTGLVVVAHALKTAGDYKGPSEWGHGVDIELQIYEEGGKSVAETRKNRFAPLRAAEVPMTESEMPEAITGGPDVGEAELQAERENFRRNAGGDGAASAPAPPEDQVFGSDENAEGSAAEPNEDLDLGASFESGLEDRLEEHNAGSPAYEATMGMLKSVARRGMGAYSKSHTPGKSRQEWAYGRVSKFLDKLEDPPAHPQYYQDHDLLPKGHPQSTRENPGPDRFDTQAEAARRARELGCEGAHAHGGGDVFMPCKSHDAWKTATGGRVMRGNPKTYPSDVEVSPEDVVLSDTGDYAETHSTEKEHEVPDEARDKARQAVRWKRGGADGMRRVGMRRALQLSRGYKLSEAELVDVANWFARKKHERKFHNTEAALDGREDPNPATVSWHGWGGEPMMRKAKEIAGELRENAVATLSEEDIEERLEKKRREISRIKREERRALKELAGRFPEAARDPSQDPVARMEKIRAEHAARMATAQRELRRLEAAAEVARAEREGQGDLFGGPRENTSLSDERLLQQDEEIRENTSLSEEDLIEQHQAIQEIGGSRENGIIRWHNDLSGEDLRPSDVGGARVNPGNVRPKPQPQEYPGDKAGGETFGLNVEKETDAIDPPPGRLGRFWNTETLKFAFPVMPWHMDPEKTARRFGLQGVQFGRWMEADTRAWFLAKAAQGLEEIALVLGVNPERVGQGEVTLALGARGVGGKPVAHFEPSTGAVNLTKTKGPGSLAHEYGHAIDFLAGSRLGVTYASGGRHTRRTMIPNLLMGEEGPAALMEELFAVLFYEDAPRTSAELAEASGTTLGADELQMRDWAAALFDHDNEYLQRRNEIFARTFEKWVQKGLEEKRDRTNRMLTSSTRIYDLSQYPPDDVLGEVEGLIQRIAEMALGLRDAGTREPRENRSGSGQPGLSFEDLPDECAIFHRNEALEGLEIYFPGPQPEEVTGPLKEAGWIFHPEAAGGYNYWFARDDDPGGEAMKAAEAAIGRCEAEAITTTSEPGTESGMQQSAVTQVFDVPLEDVHTDPDRFQPRGGAFSEKTASRIAEDFDPELMDPIDLWRDPEDGKLYVLAGHSRLEGYERRDDKDSIPAEIKDLTEEEAIRYALIENESGTDLTPVERAGVLRDIVEAEGIDTKKGRREKARDLFGKDGAAVDALSYLDPDGVVMDALRRFESSSSTSGDDALQQAKWIGKMRRFNRSLSDLHERNLWDYLRENFKTMGREFTSFREFREYVREVVERQFFEYGEEPKEANPEVALNLEKVQPKSPQEKKIEKMVQDARDERNEARKQLRQKRKDLIERGATEEDLERALSEEREAVRVAEKSLMETLRQAGDAEGQVKKQERGLFGSRENPAGFVYFGRTKEMRTNDGSVIRTFGPPEGAPRAFLFATSGEMDQLLLVPYDRVQVARPVADPQAEEDFEEFHHYDPEEHPKGERDYILQLPDADPEPVGTARRIFYSSDKVMRDEDEPGQMHQYYHDFEEPHAVERVEGGEAGDVLLVACCLSKIMPQGMKCQSVEVDGRGILN